MIIINSIFKQRFFLFQGFESYFSTLFRPRQDAKSVIPDMDDHTSKDQPQLVTVKRINSVYKQNPSNNSTTSLQDDQMIASSSPNIDKHGSQNSLQTSITNIFRVNHFFLKSFY
jgi:hypothetical protein